MQASVAVCDKSIGRRSANLLGCVNMSSVQRLSKLPVWAGCCWHSCLRTGAGEVSVEGSLWNRHPWWLCGIETESLCLFLPCSGTPWSFCVNSNPKTERACKEWQRMIRLAEGPVFSRVARHMHKVLSSKYLPLPCTSGDTGSICLMHLHITLRRLQVDQEPVVACIPSYLPV